MSSGIPDRRRPAGYIIALLIVSLVPMQANAGDKAPMNPTEVLHELGSWDPSKFVDLTHAFYPGIPHEEDLGDETVTPLFSHQPGVGKMGDGYAMDRYSLIGQWGTHVDPPIHFIDGMRTLDEIPVQEMILPLVVLDIHKQAAADPDYVISLEDVHNWEQQHGPIPAHSFVALRTDWSKRWPNKAAFYNRDKDGVAHYPGWSRPVLQYLDVTRNVTAIGHETSDTDPGIVASRGKYPLEAYHLGNNKYQIEMMANLDKLPPSGAVIIATWPKPRHGSGFPARVFALIP